MRSGAAFRSWSPPSPFRSFAPRPTAKPVKTVFAVVPPRSPAISTSAHAVPSGKAS